MERRKDNKGKVLKEGESQRKDGTYQYRWTDQLGKRHTIYAKDLKTLREKKNHSKLNKFETQCTKTVFELVKDYLKLKESATKISTAYEYESRLRKLDTCFIATVKYTDVKRSDAIKLAKELYDAGNSYGTISNFLSMLRQAYQIEYEDGTIDNNPFCFKLSSVIPNQKRTKYALSEEQYSNILTLLNTSGKAYKKHLNEIIVLYETGIRISELCGLTITDVDFKNRKLHINHQLLWNKSKGYYIQTPKSQQGIRNIPLTKQCAEALKNIILEQSKRQTETMIDGHVGFLFLKSDGTPKRGKDFTSYFEIINKKYQTLYEDDSFHITPHTFRHTFCSRMIKSGLDIKSVQYLMGHATSKMTLEVYAHVTSEDAEEAFWKAFPQVVGE